MLRLVYIDRLRGLAMLSVVMGHFSLWCLENENAFTYNFVYSYHMPLFMFLSGIVIKTLPSFKKCFNKLLRFLCPFLIVGIIYAFYQHKSILFFMSDSMKMGYWYLLALSLFYLVLCPAHYFKGKYVLCFHFLWFILVFAFFYSLNRYLPAKVNDLFCIRNCYVYWPWFIFGFLTLKIKWIKTFFESNMVFTICLASYIPLYYMVYLKGISFYKPLNFSAIVIFYYIFLQRNQTSTYIDKALEYIGKNTLDIYIYHYFFIWFLINKSIGNWIKETNNFLVEFLITLIGALFLSILSIILGNVIKKSNLLSLIIYARR